MPSYLRSMPSANESHLVNNRQVRVPFGGYPHFYLTVMQYVSLASKRGPNQAESPLARCGARRVTTVRSAKGSEIPEPSSG